MMIYYVLVKRIPWVESHILVNRWQINLSGFISKLFAAICGELQNPKLQSLARILGEQLTFAKYYRLYCVYVVSSDTTNVRTKINSAWMLLKLNCCLHIAQMITISCRQLYNLYDYT